MIDFKNDFIIERAKSCACTGHRIVENSFDKEELKNTFLQLIEEGYKYFLVGMAIGFDTICFKVLEEIRQQKEIKIIGCIPCKTQSQKFSEKDKIEYNRMLSKCDGKVVLSENYTSNCMFKRNRFMVDNCSVVVAYIKREYGGTFNTVNYAKRQNIKIIYV